LISLRFVFHDKAYGVDVPTEVGYLYTKKYNVERDQESANAATPKLAGKNDTGIPRLKTLLWENAGGKLTTERLDISRGGLADVFVKKPKREPFNVTDPNAHLCHSGDGSVPYLSLSWSQTWLLHAARARKFSSDKRNEVPEDATNALDHIHVSHRPRGALDWVDGPPPEDEKVDKNNIDATDDTGTTHPHGTRYSKFPMY
jgi:hypothetical protein